MSNSETDKKDEGAADAGVVSIDSDDLDDSDGIKIFNTDRPTGLMSGFGDVSCFICFNCFILSCYLSSSFNVV